MRPWSIPGMILRVFCVRTASLGERQDLRPLHPRRLLAQEPVRVAYVLASGVLEVALPFHSCRPHIPSPVRGLAPPSRSGLLHGPQYFRKGVRLSMKQPFARSRASVLAGSGSSRASACWTGLANWNATVAWCASSRVTSRRLLRDQRVSTSSRLRLAHAHTLQPTCYITLTVLRKLLLALSLLLLLLVSRCSA